MKRNLFLTSTLAAALLLTACAGEKEETKKEETVEEERAIEETIEPTEPVIDEVEPQDPSINDPEQEQTPVTTEPSETPIEGVVTNVVTPPTDEASTEVSTAVATPTTAIDVSTKKNNEIIIYTSDANAEQVIPTAKIAYQYKTNGPITKYIVDQLGYEQYYNKHSVSADEKVITIDFKESILSSSLIQGSAGGKMFEDSIVASIFENIPKAQTVKLRVNGKEESTDHVSFEGEIKRSEFNR